MRYYGKLGVAEQTEVRPGIWEETITEHELLGELVQRTEVLESESSILPKYRTTTSISVLSLAVGQVDNSKIRYVTNAGERWVVDSIVNQPPRLVMYIKEKYHGPATE